MEDLKLKNMTKSAKGTVEEPGKNVRQKTGLNRSLARVAPYAMRMAIHWAVFKANGRLILVDPTQNLGFRSCRRRRKTVDLLVAQANPGHFRG